MVAAAAGIVKARAVNVAIGILSNPDVHGDHGVRTSAHIS
jgi:hypothetical protein